MSWVRVKSHAEAQAMTKKHRAFVPNEHGKTYPYSVTFQFVYSDIGANNLVRELMQFSRDQATGSGVWNRTGDPRHDDLAWLTIYWENEQDAVLSKIFVEGALISNPARKEFDSHDT
jgi:hypothetical protein